MRSVDSIEKYKSEVGHSLLNFSMENGTEANHIFSNLSPLSHEIYSSQLLDFKINLHGSSYNLKYIFPLSLEI